MFSAEVPSLILDSSPCTSRDVLLKALTQFVEFLRQLDDYVGERIADVLGIGDDDAFAVAQNDVSGDADDGGIGGARCAERLSPRRRGSCLRW